MEIGMDIIQKNKTDTQTKTPFLTIHVEKPEVKTKRVLIVPDICGNFNFVYQVVDQFLGSKEKYDHLIFLGNYCKRAINRCTNDYFHTLQSLTHVTELYGNHDEIIMLMGKHDLQYMYPQYKELRMDDFDINILGMSNYFFSKCSDFQYAFGIGNHLFTNRGLSKSWLFSNYVELQKVAEEHSLDIRKSTDYWKILNRVFESRNPKILFEKAGVGGMLITHNSPINATYEDIRKFNPPDNLHQIISGEPVTNIYKFTKFKDSTNKPVNTSITLCNVLNSKNQFLTLEIPYD